MGNFWLDYDKNHRDETPITQKYAATIGDGHSCDIIVSHRLNTMKLVVQCFDNTYTSIHVTFSVIDPNSIMFHFPKPPALKSIRVIIIG